LESLRMIRSVEPNSPQVMSPPCAGDDATPVRVDGFSLSFRTETSAFDEPIKCSPIRWRYPPFVTSWGLSSKLKVVRVASRLGKCGDVSTANLFAASSKCCCVAASGVGVAGNSFAGGSRKADLSANKRSAIAGREPLANCLFNRPSATSVSRSESSTSLIFRAISISDLRATLSVTRICSSCATVSRFAAHDGNAIMGRNTAIRIHRTPQPHFPTAPRVSGPNLQSKKHTLNAIEADVQSTPECRSLASDVRSVPPLQFETVGLSSGCARNTEAPVVRNSRSQPQSSERITGNAGVTPKTG